MRETTEYLYNSSALSLLRFHFLGVKEHLPRCCCGAMPLREPYVEFSSYF